MTKKIITKKNGFLSFPKKINMKNHHYKVIHCQDAEILSKRVKELESQGWEVVSWKECTRS